MTEVLDRESLKALSTEARQDIIKHLSKRPYTASELAKLMNKHVTTISEHLSILEKSGLIQRKQSENKWVYYALTPKGDKLFKPRFYSWIVVLSISLLCLFGGLFSVLSVSMYSSSFSAQTAEKAADSRELMAATVNQSAPNTSIAYTDYTLTYGIGIILIIVAILGIGYLIYKKREQKIRVSI